MSFVKKWIGCISSFVTGVLALALGALVSLNIPTPLSTAAMFNKETLSMYDVVSSAELMERSELFTIDAHFTWLKVFSIIAIVVAAILIVYSIVLLLKNLNVIKCSDKVFNIVTYVVLGLAVAAFIGLLVTCNVYAIALETVCETVTTLVVNVTLGAYPIVMLVISAIALVATVTFSVIKTKKA